MVRKMENKSRREVDLRSQRSEYLRLRAKLA